MNNVNKHIRINYDSLNKFFVNNNIIPDGKTFVLAVSTGIDSSCLLDVFVKNVKAKIVVCHVNHHRRAQSEDEEEYIKKLCLELGIKLYVKKLFFDDVNNFQARARNLRYDFFDEVMKKENGDYLVLAHHGDDNVETVLMRMMRGSSLNGYSGISPIYLKNGYYIIRPLLDFSKEDIIEYQKMHKIKYYEDESNHHLDYYRNRVRNTVIPLLKQEDTDLIKKFNEFSSALRNASIVVNSVRDAFIKDKVNRSDIKIEFSKSDFLSLSQYIQEEVLFELLKKDNLSKANIHELMKIINSNKSNYKCYFKKIFDFMIEYDRIVINYEHFENIIASDINIIIKGIGRYEISDTLALVVSRKSANEVLNPFDICYNINNLPVVFRNRNSKDVIELPVGKKRIKDLLIDMKIPTRERNNLYVLEKDGDVLVVFGIRKSCKLTSINSCDIVIRLENNDTNGGENG